MLKTAGSGNPWEPRGPIAFAGGEDKVADIGETGFVRAFQAQWWTAAGTRSLKTTETWKSK